MGIFLLLGVLACVGFTPSVMAHETRPAYLEIKETSPNHYDILWRTPVSAGMRLPIVLQPIAAIALLFRGRPPAVSAGVAADREGSVDAAKNRDCVYGGAQHHTCAVGSLGAFWTIQRLAILLGSAR